MTANQNNDHKFYLNFIFELTVAQRSSRSDGLDFDEQYFRVIHWASAKGTAKTRTALLQMITQLANDAPIELRSHITHAWNRALKYESKVHNPVAAIEK